MAARRQPQGSSRQAARPVVEDDVGPRLRAHREQRQLSLRELARRLSISPSALSQIETGKSRPSVSTLYAIVSELGISLDELFGGRQPPKPRTARRTAKPPSQAKPAATPAAIDSDRVQR